MSTDPAARQRLVVELSTRTAADLAWLVDAEQMNKTTIVNRAVQTFRLLAEIQGDGGTIEIREAGNARTIRLRLL